MINSSGEFTHFLIFLVGIYASNNMVLDAILGWIVTFLCQRGPSHSVQVCGIKPCLPAMAMDMRMNHEESTGKCSSLFLVSKT